MTSDEIEAEIQRTYKAWQNDPGDPSLSLKIGQLYEQRKEYASAIPWFEASFEAGGRIDSALELRMVTLRLKGAADEIEAFRKYLAGEDDAEIKKTIEAKIDSMLNQLNALLKEKKNIERRNQGLG